MRPLFAIAPLALAFVLLGPTTADVSSGATPSFLSKVWHMVFDQDVATAPAKPTRSAVESSALNR